MSDEEEEGVVCFEGGSNPETLQGTDNTSGSSSLGSPLIDLHEGLVDDF